MHLSQQRLITHIKSLEDTVIALSDSENDSVNYNRAQKIAKLIKRKRQEKKTSCTDESDASEENNTRKRAPRFRKQFKGNALRHCSLEMSKENQNKDSSNQEEDDGENTIENE